jgi:hypothetical protein
MPKFIIEREIPNVGKLSKDELKGIAGKSNEVLHEMNTSGTDVHWVQSYVTGDKIYCVYNAPNADVVREHARRGGFPADSVEVVSQVIDPTTAE